MLSQLDFLNGQSKIVKTILYLALGALITGYAGASGWVFTQVMNRPSILAEYQKKTDSFEQELRYKDSLKEHKEITVKRVDRLEDYINSRFNRVEELIQQIGK